MPALRMVALLSLGLIIGLGTGLGTGYTLFNPQDGALQEKLTAAEGKAVSIEAKYNDAIGSKEKTEATLQQALQENDAKVKSLQTDIAARNSQLLNLQDIKIQGDKILAERAALEKELEASKKQLQELMGPDVKLLGFAESSRLNEKGQLEHTVKGYVINFGNRDSPSAKLVLTWSEMVCACQVNQISRETIEFTNIKAHDIVEFTKTYSFKIDLDLKTVDTEFTWQK